jgi:uncharacterized protein (TIGR03067 family)
MRRQLMAIGAFGLFVLFGSALSRGGEKDDASAKALAKLQGSWQCVEEELKGKATAKADAKKLHLIVDGEMYQTVHDNDKLGDAAKILNIDGKNPGAIDIEWTTGANKGKRQLGIYLLFGDRFEVCWSDYNSDRRPKKLDSNPGPANGRHVLVYKKEDKAPVALPADGTPQTADIKLTLPKKWKAELEKREGNAYWFLMKEDTGIGGGRPQMFIKVMGKGDPKWLERVEKDEDALDHIFPYGRRWKKTLNREKLLDDGYVLFGETWVGGFTKDSFLLVGSHKGTRLIFFGENIADKTDRSEMFRICKTATFAEK